MLAFADVSDLARRAQFEWRGLERLAATNTLASLAGHRDAALWQAVAAAPEKAMLRDTGHDDDTPDLLRQVKQN